MRGRDAPAERLPESVAKASTEARSGSVHGCSSSGDPAQRRLATDAEAAHLFLVLRYVTQHDGSTTAARGHDDAREALPRGRPEEGRLQLRRADDARLVR